MFSHVIVSAAYYTIPPSQYLISPLEKLKKLPSEHRTASHLLRNSKIVSDALFTLGTIMKPKMVTYGLLGITSPFPSLARPGLCKTPHPLKVIKLQ